MTYTPTTWRQGIEKAMEDAVGTNALVLQVMVTGEPIDFDTMPRTEILGFFENWMVGMQGVVRLIADKLDEAGVPFERDTPRSSN